MKPLLLCCLLLSGCGTTVKVKGGTTNTVSGEVRQVQEIILRIDVSACEQVNGKDKSDCIINTVKSLGDLVILIKSLTCKDQACIDGTPLID